MNQVVIYLIYLITKLYIKYIIYVSLFQHKPYSILRIYYNILLCIIFCKSELFLEYPNIPLHFILVLSVIQDYLIYFEISHNNVIQNYQHFPIILDYILLFIYLFLQERYKNDLNIAIQLLQCKPSHFVSQKYDNVSKYFEENALL